MSHYRAAIIGLGNIAWRFDGRTEDPQDPLTHAGAYNKDHRVLLSGGCSNNPDDRTGFSVYYNIPAFVSVSELLEKTKPDIVSICSPSDVHFDNLQQCLEENIPMIWLEKPPAETLRDLDVLIKKIQQSKSTILVNYQRRYCRPYQKLREVFQSRPLGKPVYINMTYSKGLIQNGSHIIDMAFFLAGDNRGVSIEYITHSGDKDNPSFVLGFPDGLSASVNGMSLPYHNIDISLTCEQGRASVIHGGMNTRWEVRSEHELFPGFYRLREGEDNFLGTGGFDGCMTAALDDLIRSYEAQSKPLSTPESARNTQMVIDSVYKHLNDLT